MITFREGKILFDHWLHYKEIKQANEKNLVMSAYKWHAQLGVEPYKHQFGPHPGIENAVEDGKENLAEFYYSGRKFKAIGFGDSILKLTQYKLNALDPLLNFALSGSGSPDMAAIAELMYPDLENCGYNFPDAVYLGTLGGNPLLSHQDFEYVRSEAAFAFKKIRELFPHTKIVVYGIPPVFDVYATHYANEFNQFLLNLVMADGNACYIDLYFRFAGPLSLWLQIKMFPSPDDSIDGIHLSGKAILEFDKCLQRAIAPGVVVV